MGFVSDADMAKMLPEQSGGAPKFLTDEEMAAHEAQVAPAKPPSFLEEAAAHTKQFLSDITTLPSSPAQALRDAGAGFKGIGKSILDVNAAVAHDIAHPIETFQGSPLARVLGVSTPEQVERQAAQAREIQRGALGNLPLANLAVQHLGGIPESSAEDTARAPGAQPMGSFLGMAPAAELASGVVKGTASVIAPKVAKVAEAVGSAAEERNVTRALDKMGEKVNKRARVGLEDDRVAELVREDPAVRKAAGNDEKLAETVKRARTEAVGKLDEIYKAAPPEVDLAVPIAKMDAKIAELSGGTSSKAEIAAQLQKIRDEMNDRLGARQAVSPKELRAEQSDYQGKGYGTAIKGQAGYEEATARIEANREASKAVGDAVFEHVTGMDYEAAKVAAAKDPKSLAARLLKANDTVTAVGKIEHGIADRAGKPQSAGGLLGAAKRVAAHAVAPALVGASHGLGAGIVTAVGQEALHALPGAARGTLGAIDRGIARGAPALARAARSAIPDPAALARFVEAARNGNTFAQRVIATVAKSPVGAARLAAAGQQ